jgi:hypothetical protein
MQSATAVGYRSDLAKWRKDVAKMAAPGHARLLPPQNRR